MPCNDSVTHIFPETFNNHLIRPTEKVKLLQLYAFGKWWIKIGFCIDQNCTFPFSNTHTHPNVIEIHIIPFSVEANFFRHLRRILVVCEHKTESTVHFNWPHEMNTILCKHFYRVNCLCKHWFEWQNDTTGHEWNQNQNTNIYMRIKSKLLQLFFESSAEYCRIAINTMYAFLLICPYFFFYLSWNVMSIISFVNRWMEISLEQFR